MMKKSFPALTVILFAFILTGCREDKDTLPPVISFGQQVYEILTDEEITIEPVYENCGNATYLWTCNGETLSTEPSLTFMSREPGEFYILLTAANSGGSDREEIGIFVYGQMPPKISMPGAAGGFRTLKDSTLTLAPEITSGLPYTCSWTIGGQEVSQDSVLTFPTSETGTFDVSFSVENRDGSAKLEFTVTVLSPADAFSWTFTSDRYSLSSGRSIVLSPVDISYAFDAEYTWSIDGEQVQTSANPEFIFSRTEEGTYGVSVTMTNSYTSASHDLSIQVCAPEGTYMRPAGAGSNPMASSVLEYIPAPGQFINDGFTAATDEEACRYALGRLNEGSHVSLGAFGGYLTAGFDHSVESSNGGYDLQITGNAHESSSEPGIIWVSQDENGDGLPNDTWYELRGSEYGKEETWQDYAVTYYRPSGPKMPVEWTDNRGGSGTVDYLPAYHAQSSYYPAWVDAGSYTLRGTRLQDRLTDESGNGSMWIGYPFGWGYADNWSATDPDIDKFRISDAVQWDGSPANLKYIDFVRIQCGVQAKGGWTGEQSTEITLIRDLHL